MDVSLGNDAQHNGMQNLVSIKTNGTFDINISRVRFCLLSNCDLNETDGVSPSLKVNYAWTGHRANQFSFNTNFSLHLDQFFSASPVLAIPTLYLISFNSFYSFIYEVGFSKGLIP